MKRLFYLIPFVMAAAAGCNKNDNDGGEAPGLYLDVPNWQTVQMIADMQGGGQDTVYAYSSVSGTFIQYKGRPYRVKAQATIPAYPVTDTASKFYVTVFDGSDNPVTDCFVVPGKYFRNGAPVFQSQSIDPTIVPPFDTGRLTPYYSR
jgi:hypothetical protein